MIKGLSFKLTTSVCAAALGVLATSSSSALTIIDPNFSVCALGTTAAQLTGTNTSCTSTQDPQQVTSAGVTVGVIGNAGSGPLNPFLLLIAVPSLPSPLPGSPAPAPVLGTSTHLTEAFATSGIYGQTNTPADGSTP